jgi:GTP-binding protein
MRVQQAAFVTSSQKLSQCPPTAGKPEYAFIGRSNVGKSSLINMICNKKDLAKTSGRPGKTQLINHFLIDERWYLVDLPGYGYAKVSKVLRAAFDKMISGYILGRENLQYIFVLVDIRHDLQKLDLDFMIHLGESNIPFCIVFTKSDKLGKTALQKQIDSYQKQILEYWEEMPQFFVSSAETNLGREEILGFIDRNNTAFFKELKTKSKGVFLCCVLSLFLTVNQSHKSSCAVITCIAHRFQNEIIRTIHTKLS